MFQFETSTSLLLLLYSSTPYTRVHFLFHLALTLAQKEACLITFEEVSNRHPLGHIHILRVEEADIVSR